MGAAQTTARAGDGGPFKEPRVFRVLLGLGGEDELFFEVEGAPDSADDGEQRLEDLFVAASERWPGLSGEQEQEGG